MNPSHPDIGSSETTSSTKPFQWLSDVERGEAAMLIAQLRKSLLTIIHREWSDGSDMWTSMRKAIFQSRLQPAIRRTIARAIIDELRHIPDPSRHVQSVGDGIVRVTDSVRFLLENRHSENGTLQSRLQRIEADPATIERVCSELGVPTIPEGILYMWGAARIIARRLLDIPDNPYDVLRDLDLYAIGTWIDRVTLQAEFSSRFPEGSKVKVDLEGIQTLPNQSEETLAQVIANRDCSLNEILISKNSLYITERAIESLETGVITLGNQPRSAYGVNWQDGKPTMRALYRIIKFVVEGKATWFDLPWEVVRDIPDSDHYWFMLLTRILETEPLRLRDVRMYRLCEILSNLDVVSGRMPDEILRSWALEVLMSEKDVEWYLIPASEQREMKWLSGKLAKAVERKVLDDLGLSDTSSSGVCNQESWTVELYHDTVGDSEKEIPLERVLSGKTEKEVRLPDIHDVPANFAWMVDALARKFALKKREVSERMRLGEV